MSGANRFLAQRGNALVLAVLILMALTSVGVVSIHRTNMDLLVAGNVVRAMQAGIGGESGADHGVGLVGALPDEYSRRLEAQRLMAMGHTGVQAPAGVNASMTQTQQLFAYSTAVPDPSGVDVNQHLPVVASDNPLARARQDVAYDMNLTYVGKAQGWEGYDVNADICHRMFDFNARGGVPSQMEMVSATLPPTGGAPACRDSVIVPTRARAVAGPVPCK